jgi:hypothetical protein
LKTEFYEIFTIKASSLFYFLYKSYLFFEKGFYESSHPIEECYKSKKEFFSNIGLNMGQKIILITPPSF